MAIIGTAEHYAAFIKLCKLRMNSSGLPQRRMSAFGTQIGHCHRAERCPLLGVKRTWAGGNPMSAFDPKRT